MEKTNSIQLEILIALKYMGQARFRDLNRDNLPTDLFSYHLRALKQKKLISKNSHNLYELTQEGQLYAGRLDEHGYKIQTKLHFSFVCSKTDNNGKKLFLIHTRRKAPYMGWSGFPSAKIDLNESYVNNAKKKFTSKTGLIGDPIFKGLHHILVQTDTETVEDKSFMIVKMEGLKGTLRKTSTEGENQWIRLEELEKKELTFPEIKKYIKRIDDDGFQFFESTQRYN